MTVNRSDDCQAHVKLARRVLNAVSKHKAKRAKLVNQGKSVDLPMASKDTSENASVKDLAGLTKEERLDMLVDALGHFVDDEPAQKGEGEQTVWDVRIILCLYDRAHRRRYSFLFRKSSSTPINPSHT